MKRIILINGLIAGAIAASWTIVGMFGFFRDVHSLVIGYTTMIVAFVLIFVGIKNYRDNQNSGFISFGKACQIGLLITLIASTVYVGIWLIDYYYFIPDFFEKYAAQELAKMKAAGASNSEIQKQAVEMKAYAALYKNPFYNALFTYGEILPVGLLVTLFCAVVLMRKPAQEKLPAAI